MITSNQILNYLSSNKVRFQEDYHLVRIGIFGSVARGEASAKSDIDVIIEFEENTSDLHEIKQKLRTEIQGVFNRPVDICREKYIKPFLKDRILADVIYA
jgi:predicted nucleotidyltransferase